MFGASVQTVAERMMDILSNQMTLLALCRYPNLRKVKVPTCVFHILLSVRILYSFRCLFLFR